MRMTLILYHTISVIRVLFYAKVYCILHKNIVHLIHRKLFICELSVNFHLLLTYTQTLTTQHGIVNIFDLKKILLEDDVVGCVVSLIYMSKAIRKVMSRLYHRSIVPLRSCKASYTCF